MSLTVYLEWPLAHVSLAMEVRGDEKLWDVKRRVAAAIGVCAADFALLHEGVPLSDLQASVNSTKLCEGDSIVVGQSRCLAARIQLAGTGLEGTVDSFSSLDPSVWDDVALVTSLLIDMNPGVISSVNNEGLTPLHLAAGHGNTDVARVLIQRGADVGAVAMHVHTGNTPLHFAVKSGHTDVVRLLLEYGADVSARSSSDNTPLHLATNLEVVRTLLQHKADVNAANTTGASPLHDAASMRCCDNAVTMLDYGASPNTVDCRGRSPLFYAALHGNAEMVEILIKRGAQLVVMDDMGSTPLHVASHEGHHEVVRVLVRCSACLQKAADIHGHLPIHYASMKGHQQTADFLVANGSVSLRYNAERSAFEHTEQSGVLLRLFAAASTALSIFIVSK